MFQNESWSVLRIFSYKSLGTRRMNMTIFSHEIIIFLCRISSFSLCFFRQWRHYLTTYAELIWLSADFPDGLTFVYDQVNLFYYFNQHGFGIRSKHGKYNQTRKCHLPVLSFSWVILFYTELTLFSTTWLDLVLLWTGWSRSKLCVCVRGGGGGEGVVCVSDAPPLPYTLPVPVKRGSACLIRQGTLNWHHQISFAVGIDMTFNVSSWA